MTVIVLWIYLFNAEGKLYAEAHKSVSSYSECLDEARATADDLAKVISEGHRMRFKCVPADAI